MTQTKVHWIKAHREKLRLSQDELAARLQLSGFNLTRGTISHWENGRHDPPIHEPEFRIALANALRLDIRDMLRMAGYEVEKKQHSDEGERAAYIIDQLPPEKRDLALGILEQFLER